jgi:Ankyrin repeats (3 copies)
MANYDEPWGPVWGELLQAAKSGDLDVLRHFINQNLEPLKQKDLLTCYLGHAASDNKIEVMSLLVEFGADVNSLNSAGQASVLCCAAGGGAVGAVKWLLTHGAKVNVDGQERCNALISAIAMGHLEVVTSPGRRRGSRYQCRGSQASAGLGHHVRPKGDCKVPSIKRCRQSQESIVAFTCASTALGAISR